VIDNSASANVMMNCVCDAKALQGKIGSDEKRQESTRRTATVCIACKFRLGQAGSGWIFFGEKTTAPGEIENRRVAWQRHQ
jgi:hypothetical protein